MMPEFYAGNSTTRLSLKPGFENRGPAGLQRMQVPFGRAMPMLWCSGREPKGRRGRNRSRRTDRRPSFRPPRCRDGLAGCNPDAGHDG